MIGPLADIAFKVLGYSTTIKTEDGKSIAPETRVYGVYSGTHIHVRDLIAFSAASTREQITEEPVKGRARTRALLFKVRSINFEIRNTAPNSSKQGNWAAYFQPTIAASIYPTQPMTYHQLFDIPGSVTGNAQTPIKINIPHFPSYWLSGREQTIDGEIGVLYIAFEDLNRTAYTDITSDQFSCSVTVQADLKVLQYAAGGAYTLFQYDTADRYKKFSHHLVSPMGAEHHILLNSVKCTPNVETGSCKVEGTVTTWKEEWTHLSKMDLDA